MKVESIPLDAIPISATGTCEVDGCWDESDDYYAHVPIPEDLDFGINVWSLCRDHADEFAKRVAAKKGAESQNDR